MAILTYYRQPIRGLKKVRATVKLKDKANRVHSVMVVFEALSHEPDNLLRKLAGVIAAGEARYEVRRVVNSTLLSTKAIGAT